MFVAVLGSMAVKDVNKMVGWKSGSGERNRWVEVWGWGEAGYSGSVCWEPAPCRGVE